jgi:hypothetical protein
MVNSVVAGVRLLEGVHVQVPVALGIHFHDADDTK